MTPSREHLMRLLPEIDQQCAILRDVAESLDPHSNDATIAMNRRVCLEAARLMAEDKLNPAEEFDQADWETILILCRVSKHWPGN